MTDHDLPAILHIGESKKKMIEIKFVIQAESVMRSVWPEYSSRDEDHLPYGVTESQIGVDDGGFLYMISIRRMTQKDNSK